MLLIDIKCSDCNHVDEYLADREELEANKFDCPSCKGKGTAIRSWISGAKVLNHSYVDGTKRGGFSELAQASSLESMAFSKEGKERNEIMKEVNRLRSTK
jgi:hypothetical protein